jgi:phage gpG-like protein
MASVVEIKLDEIQKLVSKINSYALTPSQKSGLLKSLGVEIEAQTVERFYTQIAPEGDKWHELTEAYAKRKIKKSSGGILVREGYMRDSIESQLEGSDTVLIGSTMEYADYHQNAKKEKRRRKFLGLSSDNIVDLQNAVDEFMKGKVA